MTAPHEIHQTATTIPVEQVSMEKGASSHRESALLYNQRNATAQNNLNNAHGGGKTRRHSRISSRKGKRSRSRKNYRGGVHTVPSFTSLGPQVASDSMSSTGASIQGNGTLLQSNADSKCDVCAGNSSANICTTPECNIQAGGKRISRRNQNRRDNQGSKSRSRRSNSRSSKSRSSKSRSRRSITGGNCSWGCMSGGKRKPRKTRRSKRKAHKK